MQDFRLCYNHCEHGSSKRLPLHKPVRVRASALSQHLYGDYKSRGGDRNDRLGYCHDCLIRDLQASFG